MNKRKATPDILGAVMLDTPQAIKPESNKTSNSKSHGRETSLTNKFVVAGKLEPEKNELQEKEKATFNLSKALLDDLDCCWMNLRQKQKNKFRVTKTLIVEFAITAAIKEFENEGKNSKLSKAIENF